MKRLLTSFLVVVLIFLSGCSLKEVTDTQLALHKSFTYIKSTDTEYPLRDLLTEGNCLDYARMIKEELSKEIDLSRLKIWGCWIPAGYHAVCILDDTLVFDVNHKWPQDKLNPKYRWDRIFP